MNLINIKTLSICLFISLFAGRFCEVYSQDDYKDWLNKDSNDYQKFLEEGDKKFIEFLKKDWQEFQIQNGVSLDTAPKPVKTPIYQKPPITDPNEILEIPEVIDTGVMEPFEIENPIEETTPPQEPTAIDVEETELPLVDIHKNPYQISVVFFGAENQFCIDQKFAENLSGKITMENMGNYWALLSSTNYYDLIKQTIHYKNKMRLNDWGYFLLVKEVADDLYGSLRNEKQLFIWFILNKSGYKCKVGLVGDEVYLFIPSKDRIFEVPYIKEGDVPERLFIIDFDNLLERSEGGIYTYKGDYPAAEKLLDVNIYNSPNFPGKAIEKNLKFVFESQEYVIPVNYRTGVVDFYRHYPNVSLAVYFNAAPMQDVNSSLLSSLRKFVKGRSELEAVNFILRFVQTAFEYKTDEENFNGEKPLFMEETIHYPYSDCEDRSILFSRLVKNILGLKVIGLDYPGHVATAVHFSEDVPGYYLEYKGTKYIICDPTYVNADVGISMPEYKNAELEDIIEVK